jgi:CHASE2 domain-containing sensor protein
MNRKVTVVGGAGNVGATVARAIADKELADVVIIDIAEQKAKGVALDIYEACPIEMSDSRIIGAGADDSPTALQILGNFSNFPKFSERLHQGYLNFLFLGRLMIHADGLASHRHVVAQHRYSGGMNLPGRTALKVRLQSAIHVTFNNPTADGIGEH